jgi:hypothetical protein
MKFSFLQGNWWLFAGLYAIISVYVVYRQATDGNAITLQEQVARHERMLAGTSEFYNPWQYRVFSTYVVEWFSKVVTLVPKADVIKAFLLFRILQTLLVFWIAHILWQRLGVRNPWLILMGIILLGYNMSHSVFQSDLSFNTYFDVLFYLVGGWLILTKRIVWIIPLMLVAALNRETSLLIPAMLLLSGIQWKPFSFDKRYFWTAAAATILFFITFFTVRLYYGYRAPEGINGMISFTDYLQFNLRYLKVYPEMIGTLAVLPVLVIIFLKRLPLVLQQWFWLMCPIWFFIHFAYSTVVESRLFLVPQTLIFVPAFIILVEGWYANSAPAGDSE